MYQLQRLQQGDMIVEEYKQKMELLIMRAGIREKAIIIVARSQKWPKL